MPLHQVIRNSSEPWPARAIPCPDGVVRIVCLRPWFWMSFERLQDQCGLDGPAFITQCFEEASKRQGDFDYALAAVLEHAILLAHHHLIEKPARGLANDNTKAGDPRLRSVFFIDQA